MTWLRRLRRVLGYCEHVWEKRGTVELYDQFYTDGSMPVGLKDVYFCTKCLTKREVTF